MSNSVNSLEDLCSSPDVAFHSERSLDAGDRARLGVVGYATCGHPVEQAGHAGFLAAYRVSALGAWWGEFSSTLRVTSLSLWVSLLRLGTQVSCGPVGSTSHTPSPADWQLLATAQDN